MIERWWPVMVLDDAEAGRPFGGFEGWVTTTVSVIEISTNTEQISQLVGFQHRSVSNRQPSNSTC